MADNISGKSGELIRKFFHTIKRNIFLILAIILICTACGYFYSDLQKPVYTATELTFYRAKMSEQVDSPYDYTATNMFLDTFGHFFEWGECLSRASWYYDDYSNNYEDYNGLSDYIAKMTEIERKTYSLDELDVSFLKRTIFVTATVATITTTDATTEIVKYYGVYEGCTSRQDVLSNGKAVDGYSVKRIKLSNPKTHYSEEIKLNQFTKSGSDEVLGYNDIRDDYTKAGNSIVGEKVITDLTFMVNINEKSCTKDYFPSSIVDVDASSAKDIDTSFAIRVKIKDQDPTIAQIKAKLLVFAVDTEVNIGQSKTNNNTSSDILGKFKYFSAKVILSDWGVESVEVVKTRYELFGAVIGIVLSVFIIYIVSLFNRSISEKDELDVITGSKCLGYIGNIESKHVNSYYYGGGKKHGRK